MEEVLDDYFEWLYSQIDDEGYGFTKLLSMLQDMDYYYSVDYDENRASDGENLRWYYVNDGGNDRIMEWAHCCTVLEMMFALALKMENITGEGDVSYWFWQMMDNVGLSYMTDRKFDSDQVYGRISNFLDREYEPDGQGNIFYIPDCADDLRRVETWKQMCWYLDYLM